MYFSDDSFSGLPSWFGIVICLMFNSLLSTNSLLLSSFHRIGVFSFSAFITLSLNSFSTDFKSALAVGSLKKDLAGTSLIVFKNKCKAVVQEVGL